MTGDAICQRADILVNPSLSEAFGMSLVEAAACQVPVVVTRVGSMPEVVEEGKTGLLVEAGDAAAKAEAILSLLRDEGQRQTRPVAKADLARPGLSSPRTRMMKHSPALRGSPGRRPRARCGRG